MRRDLIIVIIILCVFGTLGKYYFTPEVSFPDGWKIYSIAVSLVYFNTVNVYGLTHFRSFSNEGFQMTDAPAGVSICWLPFLAFEHWIHPTDYWNDKGNRKAVSLASVLFALLGVLVMYFTSRKWLSPAPAGIISLFFFIGSPLLRFTFLYPTYPHAVAFFWMSCLAYLWNKMDSPASGGELRVRFFLSGIIVGFSTLCRHEFIVLFLLPFMSILRVKETVYRKLNYFLVFFVSFIIVVSPQLITWRVISGRWLGGVRSNPFPWFNKPAVIKLLFSPEKGLLFNYPVFAIALLSIFLTPKIRFKKVMVSCVFLTLLWMYASTTEVFALRRFGAFIPFLQILFVTWVGPMSKRRRLLILTMFVGLGVAGGYRSICLPEHICLPYWLVMTACTIVLFTLMISEQVKRNRQKFTGFSMHRPALGVALLMMLVILVLDVTIFRTPERVYSVTALSFHDKVPRRGKTGDKGKELLSYKYCEFTKREQLLTYSPSQGQDSWVVYAQPRMLKINNGDAFRGFSTSLSVVRRTTILLNETASGDLFLMTVEPASIKKQGVFEGIQCALLTPGEEIIRIQRLYFVPGGTMRDFSTVGNLACCFTSIRKNTCILLLSRLKKPVQVEKIRLNTNGQPIKITGIALGTSSEYKGSLYYLRPRNKFGLRQHDAVQGKRIDELLGNRR